MKFAQNNNPTLSFGITSILVYLAPESNHKALCIHEKKNPASLLIFELKSNYKSRNSTNADE
jgi:hypothetical protein